MIDVPVYSSEGKQVGTVSLDESRFGDEVRPALLKQAVVMYQANRRQGTVGTKSRGMVKGSTRKLYRQKGTGNARVGSVRNPIRRGGGHAFAKRTREVRDLIPELYLHDLEGDFDLALRGLLGEEAPLSPSTVARLKEKWQGEMEAWQSRRLDDLEKPYR